MIWVCLPVIVTVLKVSVIILANEDNVFETDPGDKIYFDNNSNNLPLLIFQQAFCCLILKQSLVKIVWRLWLSCVISAGGAPVSAPS